MCKFSFTVRLFSSGWVWDKGWSGPLCSSGESHFASQKLTWNINCVWFISVFERGSCLFYLCRSTCGSELYLHRTNLMLFHFVCAVLCLRLNIDGWGYDCILGEWEDYGCHWPQICKFMNMSSGVDDFFFLFFWIVHSQPACKPRVDCSSRRPWVSL